MNQPNLKAGYLLNGKYEIIRQLGEGGFARVFLATDQMLKRQVAIKVLKVGYALAEEDLKRYQREAKLLAQLNHPNIISILAFDLLDDSTPFIVMEYLEGMPLSGLILERGKLPPELASNILLKTLEGLSYAHAAGIVHRDLSPANIFLLGNYPDFTPKIIDFGMSKIIADLTGKLTKTGQLMGNPPYMSPEQLTGAPVDHRTDIYALGCILYEMLSGQQAFRGDSPLTVIYMHQHEYPPPPACEFQNVETERLFKAIMLRCLQKIPESRFQSCHDLAESLSKHKTASEILEDGQRISLSSWKIGGAQTAVSRSGMRFIAVLLLSICLAGGYLYLKRQSDYAKQNPLLTIRTVTNKDKPQTKIFEKQLQDKIKRYGPKSPLLLKNLEELAELYESTSEWEKSLPLREQSVLIRTENFGETDEKRFPPYGLRPTVDRRFDLAATYVKMNKLDKAESELKKILKYRIDQNGKGGEECLKIYEQMGDLYLKKGDLLQAEQYYKQAELIRLGSGARTQVSEYFLGSTGRKEQESNNLANSNRIFAELELKLGQVYLAQTKYKESRQALDNASRLCDLAESQNSGIGAFSWLSANLAETRRLIKKFKSKLPENENKLPD